MLSSTYEGSPRVRPLPMNTSQLPGPVSGPSTLGIPVVPGGNGIQTSVVTGSTGQLPVGTAIGVMKNGAGLQGTEEEVCVWCTNRREGMNAYNGEGEVKYLLPIMWCSPCS